MIINTNVNKLSYVTYISTTPFARPRNGWIRSPSCLAKYIISRYKIRIYESGVSKLYINLQCDLIQLLQSLKISLQAVFLL